MTADPSSLQRLRAIVLAEPELQRELRRTPDRATFIARLLEAARSHDLALDAAEIEAALEAAACTWTMHWMEP